MAYLNFVKTAFISDIAPVSIVHVKIVSLFVIRTLNVEATVPHESHLKLRKTRSRGGKRSKAL
jgi:hypothetical protein